MLSQHYKNWLSIEDARRCICCEKMHGQIYEIDEIPNPAPPLHEKCRCLITRMQAMYAGTATDKRKNGADWWLMNYHQLPPYYVSRGEAKGLGWRAKRGNLQSAAPGKMITMGEYYNDDGHLPTAVGRKWYEADINYSGGFRNQERIVYSNDGLVFATYDHYRTFIEIIPEDEAK